MNSSMLRLKPFLWTFKYALTLSRDSRFGLLSFYTLSLVMHYHIFNYSYYQVYVYAFFHIQYI